MEYRCRRAQQKAARRVAKMLHDTHAGTVKQKRKRVSNKNRPIMTPEKRDIITQKNNRSMATKVMLEVVERKESKDGERRL